MQLLECTPPLPGGNGQCNPCNALPHCLGGRGQCNSCHTLPHCPGGSGQCNSCNALPHYLGVVGIATPAMHYLTAWGQWTVQLLQSTASLPGGSGQCNSCNALPHRLGGGGGEEEEERLPRSHVRWALALSPGGPTQAQPRESSVLPPLEEDESRRTSENAHPSRPFGSKRRWTTTLRSDLLSGASHRPLRTVVDPPEVACHDQRARKVWVSRGITPDLKTSPG